MIDCFDRQLLSAGIAISWVVIFMVGIVVGSYITKRKLRKVQK